MRRGRLGLVLGAVHAALVALVAVAIVVGSEPDWPMAWTLFLLLDFPASLLLFPLNGLKSVMPAHVATVSSPWGDVWNFLVPLTFFLAVGTAWWYLAGQ